MLLPMLLAFRHPLLQRTFHTALHPPVQGCCATRASCKRLQPASKELFNLLTSLSTSSAVSSSCEGVNSTPSAGMQYVQRRLQRSVSDIRK